MRTCVYIHRKWPKSPGLMSVLCLLFLYLLLSSVAGVTVYADDSAVVVDPPAEDITAQEPEESSVLFDASISEAIDEATAEAVGVLTDSDAIADAIDDNGNNVVASPISDDTEPVEATHIELPHVEPPQEASDSESKSHDADGFAIEDVSDAPAPEAAEVVDEENSLVVAAWQLLEPSYAAATPLPVSGKAMYYNPGVMETVLDNRLKYKRIELCEECIGRVAMLRFGDVNRKVWLQFYGSHLEGPFHVIDAAATQHVGMLIDRDWILDVDYQTAKRWNMRMPYVTIWENPPLELLMTNFAIPLNWIATVSPSTAFSTLPHSSDSAITGQPEGYRAIKQSLKVQHRDVDSYVDLLSDLPSELFVK